MIDPVHAASVQGLTWHVLQALLKGSEVYGDSSAVKRLLENGAGAMSYA